MSVLEGQPTSIKDPLSQSSELPSKQLETGDYGPPLESISEMNDAVFGPPQGQARHFNSNNNITSSELFNLSSISGAATPELTSPPIVSMNEETTRPTWNSFHEPRALDASLHSLLSDQ